MCPRSSSFLPVIQFLLDMLVEVVRVQEEEEKEEEKEEEEVVVVVEL